MIRWIASRLLAAVVTMLVASMIIYGALKLVPGDPLAAITSGAKLTPEQKDALREALGLNQDVVTGFVRWFSGIVHLDFGQSFVYGSPVTDLIGARLGTTVVLVVYSLVLAVVIGLTVALVSAIAGRAWDRAGLVLTSVAIATPSFIVALILLGIFAVQVQMFPATGSGEGLPDMLYHLTLPAIALAFSTFGILARVARAAFRSELASEHVEVARSRGTANSVILRRHVVRNSLGPIATVTGLLLAGLFIGTAVVETAFGVPGVGSLLITAISRRDFPVVQAISLMSVGLFVVTSLIVDLVMPVIDPRVRRSGGLR